MSASANTIHRLSKLCKGEEMLFSIWQYKKVYLKSIEETRNYRQITRVSKNQVVCISNKKLSQIFVLSQSRITVESMHILNDSLWCGVCLRQSGTKVELDEQTKWQSHCSSTSLKVVFKLNVLFKLI